MWAFIFGNANGIACCSVKVETQKLWRITYSQNLVASILLLAISYFNLIGIFKISAIAQSV
jgi:hypothetical protein